MSSPADSPSRVLVTDLVRLIAAGTGFTTIARFGEQAAPVPVALTRQFAPRSPHDIQHPNYAGLLYAQADQERREPCRLRPIAVALILPERDVAYVRFGTDPMTVLTVGRSPYDDPATRAAVADGLDALLRALHDNQPPPRPAGRPFAAGSASPDTPTPAGPPTWPLRPRPGRGGHRGPHR